MTLAQRPVRTWENSTIMELDSSVGLGPLPAAAEPVDDAAVLHVGRQQAERHLSDFRPGDAIAVAERALFGGQQPILLEIERHRAQPAERLVVDIGEAGIDLEIMEHRQDLE